MEEVSHAAFVSPTIERDAMSESYTISQSEQDGIAIFQITGYFGEQGGEELATKVDELLCRQKGKMIFDFSHCGVLCSPGVGCLLEIVGKVIEEFNGSLAFTGLDPIKLKVLSLTHVTTLATIAQTPEEAIESLKNED